MDAIVELLESESEDWSSSSDEDLDLIFSSDSSSSDSMSVSDIDTSESEEHISIKNSEEILNKYSDQEIKEYFRLTRTTVHHLIDMFKGPVLLRSQQKGGRQCLGAEKEICIFLWYMGNTNSFQDIGKLFGVSKSGAWNAVVKVSTWLISIGHNYIKWPSAEKIPNIMAQSEQKKKIPNVIGAIDCSHIRIKAPSKNKYCFFNSTNRYYSVRLQAVVDINKKIIDVFAGEHGSLDDCRVLKRSQLYQEAHTNPEETFPHNSVILGDSAYPLLNWLITPFNDCDNLSHEAVQFNVLHSSAREIVKNAFEVLKTKFRRLLHFTEQSNIKIIVNLIICACILHNIGLDEYDGDIDENTQPSLNESSSQDLEPEPEESSEGIDKRQQIIDYLVRKQVITSQRQ